MILHSVTGRTGLFCPCVLYGRNIEAVREEIPWTQPCVCHAICVEGGMALAAVTALFGGYIDPQTTVVICEGLFFAWWMCGIYSGLFRQELQKKYHLKVNKMSTSDHSHIFFRYDLSDWPLWSSFAECAVWSLHGSLLLALVCFVSRTQGDEESSFWCRSFIINYYGSSSSSSDEHRGEKRRFIFFIIVFISIICQKPTQWSRDGPSIGNIPYYLCCLFSKLILFLCREVFVPADSVSLRF